MRSAVLLAGPLLALPLLGATAAPAPAAPAPPAPAATPAAATTPAAGQLLFTIDDPRVAESSGLAAASAPAGVLWTHNDSGDSSRMFAIGPTGRTLAVVTVPAVAVDVEDIAVGPGDGGRPAVYLADIGDNDARRSSVQIRRIPEPVVDLAGTDVRITVPPRTQTLTYPDGPHDAEALLVHPRTGQLLVVTKDLLGGTVYEAPPGGDGVLTRRGAVATRLTGTPGGPGIGPAAQLLVTGGSVSPDGRRAVLRTYTDAYVFAVPGQDLVAALQGAPVVLPLPATRQGEGITFSRDGTALLTSSEGRGSPVYRVPISPLAPLPVVTPPAAAAVPGKDSGHGPAVPLVMYAIVGASVIGGCCAVASVRRRRGAR